MTFIPRTRYKPGDVYAMDNGCEFVALGDGAANDGCSRCIGASNKGGDKVCDLLPMGCGEDEIVWKPHNELAKHIKVVMILEGEDE
jgi:hypothetical protein